MKNKEKDKEGILAFRGIWCGNLIIPESVRPVKSFCGFYRAVISFFRGFMKQPLAFGQTKKSEDPEEKQAWGLFGAAVSWISRFLRRSVCGTAYYTVSPAFFELSMKTKYSGSGDCSRMFDIIRASQVYDLGRIFSTAGLNSIPQQFRTALQKNTPQWASLTKATVGTLEKLLAEIVEKLGSYE